MNKPKYIGMQSGNWTCTYYGIDYLQPTFKKKRDAITGKLVRGKSAGHRQYYYIFERKTSDGLADKIVRLNAYQILKVKKGKCTVEDIANDKRSKNSKKFVDKVSYCFCD
jgi:hypothetical protein